MDFQSLFLVTFAKWCSLFVQDINHYGPINYGDGYQTYTG